MTITDALLTDEYTLKMAQSYYRHGQNEQVSFELFVRRLPEPRNYLLVAGINAAVDYLERWHFSKKDVEYLKSTGLYTDDFIKYMGELDITEKMNLRCIEEGTTVNAQTPILTVTAPRIQATMIEPALLTIIGHQTMIASKAARIVHAAQGVPVWDFSMRRLHGPGAAVDTARAAYIAGCVGTATVSAGRDLRIPTTGTMAHQFVQGFGPDNEAKAFEQFLLDYPDEGVLLVDTYDTARGVDRAIEAARNTGINPTGIRIDSANLEELTKLSRKKLDAAGLTETKIVLSNDLDEYKIKQLLAANTPIDAFGVGTMLGTSADAPNLGIVYKLVEQDREPKYVMKTSPGKWTDPGLHQVWRTADKDVLGMAFEAIGGEPLLKHFIEDGKAFPDKRSLAKIREDAMKNVALLNEKTLGQEKHLHSIERTPMLEELREKISQAN